MITVKEVRENLEVDALIRGAQKQLNALGYTEHGHRHISIVSKRAGDILEKLGYNPSPKYNEKRVDIVQTICFGKSEPLIKYCQGIQMGSPIDSNSVPEPWDMPGYTDQIIMAARSIYTRFFNRVIL